MDWNEVLGSDVYAVTHYVADHDIASPMEVVVTAPATGAWWLNAEVLAHATETLLIEEGVSIGVAGNELTFRRLNRGGDYPDAGGPDVEQGGTYTGGTTIYQAPCPTQNGIRFRMKPSTSYQITVTSKADDNRAALQLMTWKGP